MFVSVLYGYSVGEVNGRGERRTEGEEKCLKSFSLSVCLGRKQRYLTNNKRSLFNKRRKNYTINSGHVILSSDVLTCVLGMMDWVKHEYVRQRM